MLLAATGCAKKADNIREWRAEDHDRGDPAPGAAPRAPARAPGSAAASGATLIEVTWGMQCAPCHGAHGLGDGPQGPMVKAPDLTRADWQEKTTDEQIAFTISKGRNKMPAFDLPPESITGLVRHVRALAARGR